MNGLLLIPPAPLSARERMTRRLDAMAYGLLPPAIPACPACRSRMDGRCEPCAEALELVAVLNDGIDAVNAAPTEEKARAAFLAACESGLSLEGGAR